MTRPAASLALVGLWAVALLAVAIVTRPYLPVDETRYLAVAWEMWIRGDFLVPHLNGELYSHKPPLLFWMIDAGWALLGVNSWWPRMIMPLFGMAALWVTSRIATALWPQRNDIAATCVVMTGGAVLWLAFSTLLMFDVMLAFCVVTALSGVLDARRHALRGWLICSLGLGFGILTKGPVALLHIAPVAVLAPWWCMSRPAGGWARWYGGFFAAVLAGAGIALAWAIPAAVSGGEQFANQLFWQQSADRMVNSFAHRRPFWWYLPMLPLIFFPWFAWPPVWRGARAILRSTPETGVRFSLAWCVPVLVAFSLISGKQVHYLLPEFPAFALLAARGLAELREAPGRRAQWLVAGLLIAISCLAGLIVVWQPNWFGALAGTDSGFWIAIAAVFLAAVGLAVALVRPASYRQGAAILGTAVVVSFAVLQICASRSIVPAYDLTSAAHFLAAIEEQNLTVAHVGKYHGQYQFLGRLARPLQVIVPSEAHAWAQRHPEGFVLSYARPAWQPPIAPAFSQRFRGQMIYIWRAADIAHLKTEWLYSNDGNAKS